MSTIPERVQRGAEWLDTERPGWFARIALDRLNMARRCDCVIGQEFGDYMFGPLSRREAQALGCQATADDGYEELTAEWVRVITERRAAA